jgi:hypothetical protein
VDVYDIEHRTNGTFVQSFELSRWCDLYDFNAGHWHAMLRKQTTSAIAHFEWSTENGLLEYSDTYAQGNIAFAINPVLGTNLLIGATVVEFGATDGPAIGLTLAATMANLLAFLEASDDDDIHRCTYSITTGSILNITYNSTGSLGNAFPIATNAASAITSGDFLQGGGGIVTLTAPVEDIETFDGEYFYDVRFQMEITDGILYAPIVGGTITFVPGVTRDTET